MEHQDAPWGSVKLPGDLEAPFGFQKHKKTLDDSRRVTQEHEFACGDVNAICTLRVSSRAAL